ncbi:hypothetical protein HanPI659440_Chr06g0241631 [Helianthus annuus]|nr:hypothetical protein HanPI659440_Chr06g0241631 [Helianthus annuus]
MIWCLRFCLDSDERNRGGLKKIAMVDFVAGVVLTAVVVVAEVVVVAGVMVVSGGGGSGGGGDVARSTDL